ncbi:MAG TPA: hypothetical protein DD660_01080 [Mitsuokella multacida]|nr:hypothetical protein [Mitsuokella multacida]
MHGRRITCSCHAYLYCIIRWLKRFFLPKQKNKMKEMQLSHQLHEMPDVTAAQKKQIMRAQCSCPYAYRCGAYRLR